MVLRVSSPTLFVTYGMVPMAMVLLFIYRPLQSSAFWEQLESIPEEQMIDNVLAVNIPEAARRLGLSQRTVATLVLSRELPSRKVGRRRIIPVVALEAFVRRDHGSGVSEPTQDSKRGTGRTR